MKRIKTQPLICQSLKRRRFNSATERSGRAETYIIDQYNDHVWRALRRLDFKHRRLLVVQPLVLPGEPPEGDFIALDTSQAGIGDTVLVNREGNGARAVLKNPDGCVISIIVGIVDSLYIEEL